MNQYRQIVRGSLLVVALTFASSAAFPQVLKGRVPMNVKLGLWEMTTVVQMSGAPSIDTSGMTAAQRAQMEAAMKSMQQNLAKPHVIHSCLTKEKLEKGFFEDRKEQSCKETILETSSTSYGVKFECPGPHPTSGEIHFVAVTPEAVKGTATMLVDGKPGSSSTTGKWLGAACGDVK